MTPTRFEIMRANRCRASSAKSRAAAQETWPGTEPIEAVPAAPFMEIEGVRYVEAPCLESSEFWHDCDGCAFADKTDEQCEHASVIGRITFGESCGPRRVIYIKAA